MYSAKVNCGMFFDTLPIFMYISPQVGEQSRPSAGTYLSVKNSSLGLGIQDAKKLNSMLSRLREAYNS